MDTGISTGSTVPAALGNRSAVAAETPYEVFANRRAPDGVGGLADHVNSPAFATSVGLVMYAHRNAQLEPARVGAGAIGRFTGRLRTLFKDFF